MSSQMLAALEAAVLAHTFPKSNVDVYCIILESGGSDLAVCVSAASLALADAGVEMRDLVSACRVVSLHCCSAEDVAVRMLCRVILSHPLSAARGVSVACRVAGCVHCPQ